MTPLKRLGLIAAGYAAAAAAAAFLVAVRYWFIDPAVVSASSGMYAGGDLIMFVLIAGTLSLAPTFFLLRLATEHYPRALAWSLLALSATGPVSLWLLTTLSSGPRRPQSALNDFLGLALVFFIFPRVAAIPVMLLVLGIACLLARESRARAILACGLALEAVPLLLIILHFARGILR